MLSMYLAGPISGCSYDECTDWRDSVEFLLHGEVMCYSPMRAKKHLEGVKQIGRSYDGADGMKQLLSGARGIMSRDYWDCHRCDILFVNLKGAETISIGTMMELAWGYQRRIPVICALDELHEHPMVTEAITHRVTDYHQGVEIVRTLI